MSYTLLTPVCCVEGGDAPTAAELLRKQIGDGREELLVRCVHRSGSALRVRLEIGVRKDVPYTRYVIPGVSYGERGGCGKRSVCDRYLAAGRL